MPKPGNEQHKPIGKWLRVRFRLLGNLHVGLSRWGYVRSGRPYLPGWTLWGALTNFFKRQGRMPGSFTEVGNRLNESCWLGHLYLQAEKDEQRITFLPGLDERSGRIDFQWRKLDAAGIAGSPVDEKSPMTFNPGVVRSTKGGADSQGQLFLTEMIWGKWRSSLWLVGNIGLADDQTIPLQVGDRLVVGGKRQTSGAEIILETMDENQDTPLVLDPCHLALEGQPGIKGVLERIVMRRTKEGKGFGRHFVDWGIHLTPGWSPFPLPDRTLDPVWVSEQSEFRHGIMMPGREACWLEEG
jgi:hypothetical protein